MREIKFRAWDYRKKQMLDFDLDDAHKVIPYTDSPIMQYTGLKDKNGKEIYEGDILHLEFYLDWIVKWHEAGFHIHILNNPETYYSLVPSNREVIGNIYENPELLKGKENG